MLYINTVKQNSVTLLQKYKNISDKSKKILEHVEINFYLILQKVATGHNRRLL